MHDPLRVVYDALEAGGWQPRGREHSFRANCPAHEGDSWTLAVDIGSDGRALLYCRSRHCDRRDIVAAIGLTEGDLFPDGHRRAPVARRTPAPVAEDDPLDGLLALFQAAGISWVTAQHPWFVVADECPACSAPSLWLNVHVFGRRKEVRVSCPKGCPLELILLALRSRADAMVMVAAGL